MRFLTLLVSLTIVSLPLYIVRCKNFEWCFSPIPLTLLEVLIIPTFVSWGVWRFLQVKSGKTSWPTIFAKFKGPLLLPSVLLFLLSILAVFISPEKTAALGIWKAYFLEPVMLSIVVFDLAVERKSVTWLLNALLGTGVWLSILAIWQFLLKVDPFAPQSILEGRVSAVFNSPNSLALFLGPLILLAFGLAVQRFKEKKLTYTSAYFLIAILLTKAFFLTQSKGGEGALLISALVFGFFFVLTFFKQNWEKRKDIFLTGFLVFYLVVSSLAFFNLSRINSLVPDKTLAHRTCIWQGTASLLESQTISGLGLSAFPQAYKQVDTCNPEPLQYPHNILLTFWVELGVFGLICFLWLVFEVGKALKGSDDFISVALLASIVYLFIHGSVDVPYFKNDLAVEFWLLVVLIAWYRWKNFSLKQSQ